MKIKAIVSLLGCLLLTSCVAAVVVSAAAGMIVYDKRSVRILERDARIFHVIHKSIIEDPRFNQSRILVVSFNQVVLLIGQTPADSLRVTAEKTAQNTVNVRRVYDEITVGYPISLARRTQDSWITGQIRSKMLTKEGLESGSIRVVTENSIVYLMGIVTPEQSSLAVSVAREVKGVQKVVKVFQYIH